MKQQWLKLEDEIPAHKDLVLVDVGIGISIPAIYYNNGSFKGFYKFTADYHYDAYKTPYTKVYLKEKHKINNVLNWALMPEPPQN